MPNLKLLFQKWLAWSGDAHTRKREIKLIFFLACFAFVFFAIKTESLRLTAWTGDGQFRFLGILGLCLLIFLILKLFKITLWRVFVPLLPVLIGLIGHTLQSMFFLAGLLISSCALGNLIFRTDFRSLQMKFAINLATGISVWILLFQWLLLFPMNTPIVYISILLVPVIVVSFVNRSFWHQIPQIFSRDKISSWPEAAGYGVLVGFLSTIALAAASPEWSWDSLVTHLHIPIYVENFGRWHFDAARSIISVMPYGADSFFTIGQVVAGYHGAKVANLLAMLAIIFLMSSYWKERNLGWAVLGGLILFVSTPLVYLEGTVLYVEGVWSLSVLLAVISLLEFLRNPDRRIFSVMVIAAAAGMSIKLPSSFVVALILGTYTFYFFKNSEVKTWTKNNRTFITGWALFFLSVGLCPYWIALFKTGNPVFPLYNNIFKSPLFETGVPFNNSNFNHPFSLKTIYDITFQSSRYIEGRDGVFGFSSFIIFPFSLLLALTLFRKERSYVLPIVIAVGHFTLIWQFQTYLRYVFPSLVLLTLITPLALNEISFWSKWHRRGGILFLCLVVGLNSWLYTSAAGTTTSLYDTDKSVRDRWVLDVTPELLVNDYLNENHPGEPVAYFKRTFWTGLKADSVALVWYCHLFASGVLTAKSQAEVEQTMKKYAVQWLVVPTVVTPGLEWAFPPHVKLYVKDSSTLVKTFGDVELRKVIYSR